MKDYDAGHMCNYSSFLKQVNAFSGTAHTKRIEESDSTDDTLAYNDELLMKNDGSVEHIPETSNRPFNQDYSFHPWSKSLCGYFDWENSHNRIYHNNIIIY